MQRADLVPERAYAVRERPRDSSCPLMKVKYLGVARHSKAKVRYDAGELAGLEDWLPTRCFICPWDERAAFLRDEHDEALLREASERDRDPVVEEAISGVMEASGDETGFIRTWVARPERVLRMWRRAGLETDPRTEPHAYLDRKSLLHLSFGSALKWAQAFAAEEPEPVLLWVAEWEARLRAEGWEPGARHAHERLREAGPAYALIREWAGVSERERLEAEIQRLRDIVHRAIGYLEASGASADAGRVRRALSGH